MVINNFRYSRGGQSQIYHNLIKRAHNTQKKGGIL